LRSLDFAARSQPAPHRHAVLAPAARLRSL